MKDGHHNTAVCQCGRTAIELSGEPILSVICHCRSCRTAAVEFEQAQGAPRVLDAEGGVDYCLYRKDRVKIVRGAEHLREHRLKPTSPTRRMVAACCNSPMFLDFTKGHWLTVFRDRLTGEAPAPQMRVMAKDRAQGVVLSDAIATYDTHPAGAMGRLLAAWAAMGFRRPAVGC
ncbi:MAG: DUF6151 family protein [Caulobacteraceae bacterium]